MAFSNYRKRRPGEKFNKNELKVARQESAQRKQTGAGSLRQRYPELNELTISFRMESATGAILEESDHKVDLNVPLQFDAACAGGCSGGVFLLDDAVNALLSSHSEKREGMAICQTPSYRDPQLPCGTKFYFDLTARY